MVESGLSRHHRDKIIYFHDLKFDGSFILDYLIRQKETPQAFNKLGPLTNHDMPAPSVKYSISNKGQWYTITYKPRNRDIIEFRDSLKLLPFSVRRELKAIGLVLVQSSVHFSRPLPA